MLELPEHSPLGASGMNRWMVCPGSVSMSVGLSSPSSELAMKGTDAHKVAAYCLEQQCDAWTLIARGDHHGYGFTFPDGDEVFVDKNMADAVQVYLNAVRSVHPDAENGDRYIEYGFHCPSIHAMFYGRSDFVHVSRRAKVIHVWDYKHGAGIVVDVEENPQCMYYAVGVLESMKLWDQVDTVVLHIAQPRGYHSDGPLRQWSIKTTTLWQWLEDYLLPAMERAEASRDTISGEHCRFCPVRSYACPQLLADFDELEKLMNATVTKGSVKKLSNAQIGRLLTLFDTAKIVAKAATETAFTRMQAGKAIPGRKLTHARANRTWKDGAEDVVREKFGDKAFTEPKLKTPAKIEEMPEGAVITAQYAYKPEAGLTVTSSSDTRASVSKDTKSLFTDTSEGEK